MKSARGIVLSMAIALLLTSSCATLQSRPLVQGEMRLMRMEMPEIVQEDLPYDVVVTFQTDGQPEIKRACFRWLSEKISVSSPSLYCYAYEVQGNQPIGSVCTRWLAEGPYAQASPPFCADVEDVKYGDPNIFVVKIRSRNVKLYYNKLECHAEYLLDGELKTTNKVSTKIRVEE